MIGFPSQALVLHFYGVYHQLKIVAGIGLYNTLMRVKEEGGDIETGWRTIFTTPDDRDRYKSKRNGSYSGILNNAEQSNLFLYVNVFVYYNRLLFRL